jgi:L-alanine-DL-glutamate epimerase-like enolase superfamily enzyme
VSSARASTRRTPLGFRLHRHPRAPAERQLIARCIETCLAPLLVGEDAGDVQRLWHKLARNPALQWVGRAGLTTLAHAAIDVALWDIKAKAGACPCGNCWAAGARQGRAYNTDIGWLSIPDEQTDGRTGRCRAGVHRDQGQGRFDRRARRAQACCRAQSHRCRRDMAVDGNGKWDLATCQRFCHAARDLDLFWFEEPLWYDDVKGHAQLARGHAYPLALGEQLYTPEAFAEFINQGAVHWVQPT